MVTALITVAAIAWGCQLALGGWQIHQFNQAFDKLAQSGSIGVGRSGGRFKPRVVIAVAVDKEGIISDALIMQGLTVFARTRKIAAIQGQLFGQIEPDVIFPHDRSCQNALSLALKLKHR